MSKGKTTTIVAFRLPDTIYFPIKDKAERKHLSIGDYCKTVVLREALRRHKRKGDNHG